MEKFDYFQSSAYLEDRKDFLELMKDVSREYEIVSKDDLTQSVNFAYDGRIHKFVSYVAQSAWDILNSQGYAMNRSETRLNELWLQIYNKNSCMDQHVHSGYSQISGFYFLDVPENSGRIVLFDPRPGKNQINLPEKNRDEATYASELINFQPYPGLLFMTNSWIPHGITRHMSDEQMQVIHFNLIVKDYIPPPPPAEVI